MLGVHKTILGCATILLVGSGLWTGFGTGTPGRTVASVSSSTSLALVDVTVIDVTAESETRARLTGQTVLIAGNRIEALGPTGETPIPAGVPRVDGQGKFLIPGLWDMHAHFNRDAATQLKVMAPLMIAHGITGARDMLGDCWEPCSPGRRTIGEMRALQGRIEAGEVVAPRLLALSSPVVHGPRQRFGYPSSYPEFWRPSTEEQGRKLARFLKDRGVDFIKVYNSIPRAAFFGIMDEAGKISLPVSGHLPWSVHPIEAADAGMRTIEHARWPGMACNPAHEEWRAGYALFAAGGETDPELLPRLIQATVPQFDEAMCKEIFAALVKNDTYLVPTHLTRRMDAFAGDSAYRNDDRRKYVPASRLRGWDRDLSGTASGPPEILTYYREFFDLGLRLTGMANTAGVKLMIGTDVFDTMVFPGFSYHDELVHMSMAGLTPLEILRAATYRGAEFLRMTDDFGAVAVGKVADLVLLEADPLLDIKNSTRIDAVIFNGKVHPRADLDAMIRAVEDHVRSGG